MNNHYRILITCSLFFFQCMSRYETPEIEKIYKAQNLSDVRKHASALVKEKDGIELLYKHVLRNVKNANKDIKNGNGFLAFQYIFEKQYPAFLFKKIEKTTAIREKYLLASILAALKYQKGFEELSVLASNKNDRWIAKKSAINFSMDFLLLVSHSNAIDEKTKEQIVVNCTEVIKGNIVKYQKAKNHFDRYKQILNFKK